MPGPYRPLFAGQEDLLESHRGYDPGALAMARDLATAFAAPLVVATTSRLVVDLNRSLGHPKLHSGFVRRAPRVLRDAALERYYLPYRNRAEEMIAAAVAQGRRVIHISSHSFTPVLGAEVRNADIGLLYDPGRPGEVALCAGWLAALRELAPGLRVRRNYPYTGKSDGFCAYLRRRFAPENYVGVELEINQKHVFADGAPWRALRRAVVAALAGASGAREPEDTANALCKSPGF